MAVTKAEAEKALDIRWFGAKWDGVTDDSKALEEAMEASVEAGGTRVLLPPGTGVINSIPTVPKNLSIQIPIRGAGMRATTVKLTEALQFLQFAHTSKGDVVGNLDLGDLTVDGNNQPSTENRSIPVVVGTAISSQEQVDIQNIRIRRVRTINVPNLEAAENGRRNVVLACYHKEPGLALNRIEGIDIRECEFNGGQYGIFVGGVSGNSPRPLNVYMAHIYIADIRHVISAVATKFGSCGGVQLGQYAWSDGKDIVVERIYGENSGDVGVELDIPCTARDLDIVNANNTCLLLNTFNAATVQSPIVTQLTAKASAGANLLTVTSSAAFTVGEQIVLFGGSLSECDVRTIKSKPTGTSIELSEATGLEHATATWVQQVDDMSAVRFKVENHKATRTALTPGSQSGLTIQNIGNPIPMPAVDVDGYLYRRSCAGTPSSQGEVIHAQYGLTTSQTGNPRALRVRKLQAEVTNFENATAEKKSYAPLYLKLLGATCPIEISGDIGIFGPGVTGGAQSVVNLVNVLGKGILDVDLLIRAVVGSTGGEPMRFVALNQEAFLGDLSGRIRLRTRASSIATGGGLLQAIRLGKACGFASANGTTVTTAKIEAGKVAIPVESVAGFAVGQAIVLDALSPTLSEVLYIEKIEGATITAVSVGESPGAAHEHTTGAVVAKLNNLIVEDGDFTGVGTAGTGIAAEDAAVASRLLARGVVWPKPPGTVALSVPASGKAFQVLQTGQSGAVAVKEGTVSAVEWSPGGGTFFKVAAATNCLFSVSPGDFVKITYTVLPTVNFLADRA